MSRRIGAMTHRGQARLHPRLAAGELLDDVNVEV
jgi:hypothetical protein